MSIYSELVQAKVIIDHHESDLYVRACPTSEAILANHGHKPGGMIPYSFISDGVKWYDLPFQYEPFWEGKS